MKIDTTNHHHQNMRTTTQKIILGLAIVLAALVLAPAARAQTSGSFYSSAQSWTGSSSTNLPSDNVVTLHKGQGMVLFTTFATVAGATGSNVVASVQLAGANQVFTTVAPYTTTTANNGTNVVVSATQFTAAQLANYSYIKIGSWQHVGATNGVTGANVTWNVTD